MRQINFVVLILISTIVYSQDSITRPFSIGANSYILYSKHNGGDPCGSLVLNYKIHSLYIGSDIIRGLDAAQPKAVHGLETGYQIFPNGRNNRFDFFFEYHFDYLNSNIVLHDSYRYYIDTNSGYSVYTVNWSKHFIVYSHYIGFGFNLNMFKMFYLTTSYGIGWYWWGETNRIIANTGKVIQDDKMNIDKTLGSFLKVGIGCNFWKLKKH